MSMTVPPAVPQLHLPMQAAAPEGPADLTMLYVMHHAFRRDLRDLARVVPLTPVGDRRAWQRLESRWALLSDVLHNHHETEDAWLWPELLRRAAPDERALLEAMAAEHADLDPILEACRDGFASMVARPCEDVRSALAVRLAGAREALSRHLAHEESEALALLQRVFTHRDWEEVDAHFKDHLSPGLVIRMVPWALHELPREVQRHVFSMAGGSGFRLVWLATRRRFERGQVAAFGRTAASAAQKP
jgi:hypothetical protein